MSKLEKIDVAGRYWEEDRDVRTSLGALMHAAKDQGEQAAVDELAAYMAAWAQTLDIGDQSVIVGVPSSPDRSGHVVSAIAGSVANGLGIELADQTLTRTTSTPRLRDLDPNERRAAAVAGGYIVDAVVAGREVVLVDDVILTGTTLGYLAELIFDAGATSVRALVATRARRRD